MEIAPTCVTHDGRAEVADSLVRHLLGCFDRAHHSHEPYDHWLLDHALPATELDDIANLPLAPPKAAVFNGKREANNSSRLFFSPENQAKYSVCRDLVAAFRDARIIAKLQAVTGAPVSQGQLRIEYCQDVTGFWLEPHVDIAVKLFTMLVYLSDDPALHDAGTDIFDATPAHNRVATVPYARGKGLIFIPGRDTWHGFTKRPIAGIRKSIIVNYVTSEWKSVEELA